MKKIISLLLALIISVSLCLTAAAVTGGGSQSYFGNIYGVEFLDSVALEDSEAENYYFTNGYIDLYDVYDLLKSVNYNWSKMADYFRNKMKSSGFFEQISYDDNGDISYYWMTDTEIFYMFGEKISYETTEDEYTVLIQHDTIIEKTSKEQPSSWAKSEVDKAIAAGLVPAELQKNYTKGITREALSKMLSLLIDKCYGKAPSKNDARFTDTSDSAVLKAANLGIINGYKQADGSYAFKPNNTLKRSEMSAIINRIAKLCGKTTTGYESEVKFTDTVNHWCKSELGYPVHMGILKGTSATAFSPENTLTVEQTIMIIYRTYLALGEASTVQAIVPTTPSSQTTPSKTTPGTSGTTSAGCDYVLNMNTMKFHLPSCGSVSTIKSENRWDYEGTRESVISMGYAPCKKCNP